MTAILVARFSWSSLVVFPKENPNMFTLGHSSRSHQSLPRQEDPLRSTVSSLPDAFPSYTLLPLAAIRILLAHSRAFHTFRCFPFEILNTPCHYFFPSFFSKNCDTRYFHSITFFLHLSLTSVCLVFKFVFPPSTFDKRRSNFSPNFCSAS